PFPRPPPTIVSNPTLTNTITTNPHLFVVDSAVNVDRLAILLKDHPNRPLVESILLGFREGSWPLHDGDLTHLRTIPQTHSQKDSKLIETHVQEERSREHWSAPFSTLLPGMHVSPRFVIPPRTVDSSPRIICDQSADALNSGITREAVKVAYDGI
ncbi:hypothetical protein BDY24DRAFT_327737, partial [Mrakia frigida]|uniref:uncharacterized protein n=1 Tax=Mrakia frigida TaxID=29902 RepID=UPI003FCC01A2